MVRVTKQRVDGINSRVKENIKEIEEFLKSETKGQDFYDKATMMKARIENNLKRLKELIDEIDSQGSEITTEEYEKSQGDAEERILDLQVLIMNYKDEQQAKLKLEETEIKRKEKERQTEISAEVEKAKLQMEERIQMEKVNLERLKLELNSKKHTEKIEAEIKRTEIESDAANSSHQKDIGLEHLKAFPPSSINESMKRGTGTIRLPKPEKEDEGSEKEGEETGKEVIESKKNDKKLEKDGKEPEKEGNPQKEGEGSEKEDEETGKEVVESKKDDKKLEKNGKELEKEGKPKTEGEGSEKEVEERGKPKQGSMESQKEGNVLTKGENSKKEGKESKTEGNVPTKDINQSQIEEDPVKKNDRNEESEEHRNEGENGKNDGLTRTNERDESESTVTDNGKVIDNGGQENWKSSQGSDADKMRQYYAHRWRDSMKGKKFNFEKTKLRHFPRYRQYPHTWKRKRKE